MPFFILSDADIRFAQRKLVWIIWEGLILQRDPVSSHQDRCGLRNDFLYPLQCGLTVGREEACLEELSGAVAIPTTRRAKISDKEFKAKVAYEQEETCLGCYQVPRQPTTRRANQRLGVCGQGTSLEKLRSLCMLS